MKLVFCGFGRAGKEVLLQLMVDYSLCRTDVLVFTYDSSENADFILTLNSLGISYLTDSINVSYDLVSDFGPKYLVSAYYRHIIKDDILELVEGRAINLHPSLLPDYRGCFSSVWAILNGETQTGITIHYVTSEVDGGNILVQKKIDILEEDTAYSLYNKLISVFVRNISDAFGMLVSNHPGSIQCGDERQRYYARGLPFGGVLVVSERDYSFAVRFVRAMYFPPFAGAKFVLRDGSQVEIKKVNELEYYRCQFKEEKPCELAGRLS